MTNDLAAKRIFEYNPNAKILITLRNPVTRAMSQWNMFLQLRNRPKDENVKHLTHHFKDLSDAVKIEIDEFMFGENEPLFMDYLKREQKKISKNSKLFPGILDKGLYYKQVKRYFDTFGKKNVLILEQNELKRIKNLRCEKFIISLN